MRLGRTLSMSVTAPLTAMATAFVVLADKQIQAVAALENAVRATGRETEISVDSLREFTAELQDITTYGDEAQLSALALVQQLGNLSEQGLKAVLPGMLDFSTAMGVDLQTAASLMGKTLGSSTNALSRYGIEIDMTQGPTEKLAELTAALAEKFDGAAEAAAAAGLGPFRQMKNAAGDLAEEFGTLLLPAVNNVVEAIGGAIEWLSALDDDTKRMILTVGGLAAALGPLALAIGVVSKAMAVLTANPIILGLAAVAAGVALITTKIIAARDKWEEYNELINNTAAAIAGLAYEEQLARRAELVDRQTKVNRDALPLLRALNAERRAAAESAEELAKAVAAGHIEQWQADESAKEFARSIATLQENLTLLTDEAVILTAAIAEIDRVMEEAARRGRDFAGAVGETVEAVHGLQGVAKESGDAVQTMTDKWINWQLILRGLPAKIKPVETALLGLVAAFGELSGGPTIAAGGTMGVDFTVGPLDLTGIEYDLDRLGINFGRASDEIINFKGIVKKAGDKMVEAIIEPRGRDRTPREAGGAMLMVDQSTGGISPAIGAGIETAVIGFASAIVGTAGSVESLAMVLDPLTTIATMMFTVLTPALDAVLKPLLDAFMAVAMSLASYVLPMLTILAPVVEMLGGVLMSITPWFEFLGAVVEKIAPVLRVILTPLVILGTMFQWLAIVIQNLGIWVWNVLHPRKKKAFVAHDLAAMIQAAVANLWTDAEIPGLATPEDTDYDGGDAGATFRQQRPIEVTVNVFDNQIFGGSLQEFGLLIRDELLQIAELGL